jgi:hypothetical protein
MRTRGRMSGLLMIAAVASLACGRGRDSPTGPTRPPTAPGVLVGSWAGVVVDDEAGSGTLELAIADQAAISLTGSWAATFADSSLGDRGTLRGSVQSASQTPVTLTLESTVRTCGAPSPTFPGGPPVVAMVLAVSGDRMSGTYFSFGCGPLRGGKVDLTKR